jgi:hypothetical protein
VPTWLTEAKVVLDSTDEPPDEAPVEAPDEPPDEAPDKPPDEAPDEAPDEVPDELPNEPPSKLPDELPSEPQNEPPDEPPEDVSSNPIDGIDEVAVEPVRRLDALQKAFDDFEKEIRLRMDEFEAHEAELATRIQALEPRAPPETPRARVPRDVQPSSFSALAVERARGRKLGFR